MSGQSFVAYRLLNWQVMKIIIKVSDLHFSGFMQGKSGPFSSVSSLAVNSYCIFFAYRLKPSTLFSLLGFLSVYLFAKFVKIMSTLYNQAHLQPVILGTGKSFSLSFSGSKLSEKCNNCCFGYGGYKMAHKTFMIVATWSFIEIYIPLHSLNVIFF